MSNQSVAQAMVGGGVLGALASLAGVLGAGGASPMGFVALAMSGGLIVAGTWLRRDARRSRRIIEEEKNRAELAELRLLRQREVVDSLADGLDVAVFLCDGRGVIEYANQTAVDLFKFEDPIGRMIIAVTLSNELERLVSSTAQTGERGDAEITFRYPEERVGLAQAWSEGSGSRRVFLSIYEITKLRHLERVRRDFVANVSHELRTPMTTIRAMAETILEDEDNDPALRSRYLTRIIEEVDRLSLISDDLLTLGSAESQPVQKSNCDVASRVAGAVAVQQEVAEKAGLTLSYEGPPSLFGQVNPHQFTQIASNLIENAIKYSNSGQITVRLGEADGMLKLEVQDEGIGLTREDATRIFERFYRVDKGRSRATGGTGLGLAIVKHLAESHGGRVSVESLVNSGSTFTVTIPSGNSAI